MLVMTTPFNEIVFALRSFRVPEIFVLALWLGYRYTLLMFRELVGILIARESRRVAKTSHLEVLRMGGQALGLFFVRSIERGERVQLAMLARGDRVVRYRGKLKHLDTLYMAMLTAITFWWVVI
jgi:cobalt/nickel transport system permease protein